MILVGFVKVVADVEFYLTINLIHDYFNGAFGILFQVVMNAVIEVLSWFQLIEDGNARH